SSRRGTPDPDPSRTKHDESLSSPGIVADDRPRHSFDLFTAETTSTQEISPARAAHGMGHAEPGVAPAAALRIRSAHARLRPGLYQRTPDLTKPADFRRTRHLPPPVRR